MHMFKLSVPISNRLVLQLLLPDQVPLVLSSLLERRTAFALSRLFVSLRLVLNSIHDISSQFGHLILNHLAQDVLHIYNL